MTSNKITRTALVALVASLSLAGCAPAGDSVEVAQPLESFVAPEQAAGFTGSSCSITELADAPYALTHVSVPGAGAVESGDADDAVVYSIDSDAPLYSASDSGFERIGTLPAVMPWEVTAAPVVVIDANSECGMSEVMIPSRAGVPSAVAEPAAQASAWIPTESLVGEGREPSVVEISLSEGTVTVTDVEGHHYSVGGATFGRADEATPTGESFVLSEYFDEEGQPWTAGAPIVLLGMHSTASDGFGGNAGEIGLHYSAVDASQGSAGCVRVHDATAMNVIAEWIEPGDVVRVVS